MQDVRVEHVDAREIRVLAAERPVPREQTIQLRDTAGRRASFLVHPVASAVAAEGDTLRHRVVLQVIGPEDHRGRTAQYGSAGAGVIAVLVRRIAARAVNMSSTGCLLELAEHVAEGSVALLDILGVQRGSGDAIRLCRAARIPGGAWPWSAGAEFLPLDAPLPTSVRNVAARLEALMESGAMVGTRHKSGSNQTTRPGAIDLTDAVGETGLRTRITIDDRVN